MPLPHRISFTSLLQYSTKGTTAESRRSRVIRDALKSNSYLKLRGGSSIRAVDWVAKRTVAWMEEYPFLREVLGPERILIPVPRSAPLRPANALWPTLEICRAFVEVGLASQVLPVLKRTVAVQKSAFAKPGERPEPIDHYNSTEVVNPPNLIRGGITLVDDFVTRGSTFLGMFPRIIEAFPHHEAACLAIVRSMSGVEVETYCAPVQGVITDNDGHLRRRP